MKLSLLFCFLSILSGVSFGQNRIATVADRQIYGSYISPGDLIIDTPTRQANGKRDVVYYFMAKEWPGLRENATIWLDGDKLGRVEEIKFCNTSKSLMPWHIESAVIRNIPNTRVVARAFTCNGLKNFELNGESPSFPGLRTWPSSRRFLTGSFGFHVIGNLGGHAYHVNVRDGGTIRMNGFEAQHAFSGVRINSGKEDITVESVEISNFYIHDTATGEGQYLGATHKGPALAKLRNLKVHHGVLARTAAEALQLQHLAGGADIHHITIFAADVRWIHEFMAGQDTGIQWVVDAGENRLHHILVDGYGSVGLMPFGAGVPGGSGTSRVSNVLFNDGRDIGMYLHKSTSFGIQWVFDSIYFRGIRATYYHETGRRERDYYVSKHHGKDKFVFHNIFHDGSKRRVFEDTSRMSIGRIVVKKLPDPEYVNSGFYEPAHRIKQWHPVYAPYFPVSRRDTVKVKVSTKWNEGDIAIETEGDYAFFKCVKTHTADNRRPAEHPFFKRLTWDANGVRSDQPGWNASLHQSAFPPDDLRLQRDNYWKKLGLGFQEDLLLTLQQ